MQQQKIEFRKQRDFSSVLGDSFKFLKQNFKTFFSSIILIVGPFILLMGLCYAYMQTTVMTNITSDPTNPLGMFNVTYFLSIGALVLFGIISNILLSSVVYNYLVLYNEKPFGEKITVSEVGKRLWSNIGSLIISTIVFLLTFVVLITIMVLIGIGITSMLGVAGGVLVGLSIFATVIIFAPVMYYFIPAAFYVVVRDRIFIFPAMVKVRKYLSGNFWWTWLIMVVVLIGLAILQTIFNLPASIMAMMSMFSRMKTPGVEDTSSGANMLLMAFYTLGMFLTHCTSSISHLISAFNFMSHEENHEGKGLMSRLDEIK
ncbi:MAG: hypothetical protein V4580_15435 [Bacteroidota bacterium]